MQAAGHVPTEAPMIYARSLATRHTISTAISGLRGSHWMLYLTKPQKTLGRWDSCPVSALSLTCECPAKIKKPLIASDNHLMAHQRSRRMTWWYNMKWPNWFGMTGCFFGRDVDFSYNDRSQDFPVSEISESLKCSGRKGNGMNVDVSWMWKMEVEPLSDQHSSTKRHMWFISGMFLYQVVPSTRRGGSFNHGTWL